LLKQEENKAVCQVCISWLTKYVPDWDAKVSQDDKCSERAMLPLSQRLLGQSLYVDMLTDVYNARQFVQHRSAWRIDGTLREFPKFAPVDVWFNYPQHEVDTAGILKDQESEGDKAPWQKGKDKRKTDAAKQRENRIKQLEAAINSANTGEPPSIDEVRDYIGRDKISERTLKDRIRDHGGYEISNGIVVKKE
jgi:hypothetical protein